MTPNAALLVVDMQNDFMPGGALAVPRGHEIVEPINRLAQRFANVVLTQDWHCPGHASFASSHPGRQVYETIDAFYGPQILWPDHCVMGSHGAALHPDLDIRHAGLILRKGYHKAVDSYSAFLEADRETRTGLDGWLSSRGITEVVVCGLATDFCVGWTACDGRHFGLTVKVIEEASRAIDLDGSMARAHRNMAVAGANFVTISQLIG
ncbi:MULTISPECIES: bifunctional nicotinamidase/pyrazinamidase [unclassified Acidisoma]|jgi:nicotinamidase/pyrazinamidase|uniref:bifunctional nicotinamidase/pyrazinamidase n=1 Tax=unclassified Acidisoma TaxID=2634065 RepID=UPI00131C9E86|nr:MULTISPECIES: bifunctional nicotinamidase/pyrazinamidase [unclassified Acidisoma]